VRVDATCALFLFLVTGMYVVAGQGKLLEKRNSYKPQIARTTILPCWENLFGFWGMWFSLARKICDGLGWAPVERFGRGVDFAGIISGLSMTFASV